MPKPLPASLRPFLREAITNGNRREQALVRKWWHEQHDARGLVVWEYYLEGRYLDAVWFPEADATGQEEPGASAPEHFPLEGQRVVLCESKYQLGPELVGQALVYRQLALRAGASVDEVYAFAEVGDAVMHDVAIELGLIPVVLNTHAA